MRPLRSPFILLVGLVFSVVVAAHQPPPRDPEAIQILLRSLSAAKGSAGISNIEDFTASGMITYYWAGQEVSGPVILRARGLNQFRLDAQLPEGMLSWAVDGIKGTLHYPDGTNRPLAYHTVGKLGSRTFPFARIVAAIADMRTSISYLGQVGRQGSLLHRIEIDREWSADLPKNLVALAERRGQARQRPGRSLG